MICIIIYYFKSVSIERHPAVNIFDTKNANKRQNVFKNRRDPVDGNSLGNAKTQIAAPSSICRNI